MNSNPSSTDTDHAIDHLIDDALAALSRASPRPGLNTRILTSLEHRSAQTVTNLGGLSFHLVKGWGVVRGSERETAHLSPRLTLWSATAATLIVIASLALLHHSSPTLHHSSPTLQHAGPTLHHSSPLQDAVILSGARRAESKNPETARSTANSEPFPTTNLPRGTATTSSRPERPSTDTAIPIQPPLTNADLDAQALADLHAPSHPARPPLPLTAQEKLLRRALRDAGTIELAELNPEVRAHEAADETNAFKSFFPDPPPLKQPGDTE